MSDRGAEPPEDEATDDPPSHLRIIPPDPVPDAPRDEDPAPAPAAPRSALERPRVRVFAASDDPASMPLPAMGPGSGGSRLPEGLDAEDHPGAADGPSGQSATSGGEAAGPAAGDVADAAPRETGGEVADGEVADGDEVAEAAEAGTPAGPGHSAAVAEHDEATETKTMDPTPLPAPMAAGVAGVRLDRSDTGEVIKVSADQIQRDVEPGTGAAVVSGGGEAATGEGSGAKAPAPPASAPAAPGAVRPNAWVKVATGLGFGVVALVVILLGRPAFAVLAGILIVWAGVEYFGALDQSGAIGGDAPEGETPGGEASGAAPAVEATTAPGTAPVATSSVLAVVVRRPVVLFALIAITATVATTYFYGIEATGAMAAASLIAGLLWFVPDARAATPPRDAASTVLGIVHCGIAGSFSMLILRLEHGFALLLVVVILTVVSDVAAYAWGASLGHTPFFTSVSPKKSLEGFLGAVAMTIVAAMVVTGLHGWLYPSVPVLASWGQMFALAVLVAVSAAAGDLAESLFKRELGIKDVASFLPGHGGMFDRLDGMVFAIPVAYVFFVAMGLADVG